MTQEVGIHTALSTGRSGVALGRMPRRDSAESVGAFHDSDALNLAKRRLCDAVRIGLGSTAHC
jgi:hypothetical protein